MARQLKRFLLKHKKMGIKNILLVDDHALFRSGLKLLLSANKEYKIVHEASNGIEMLDFLSQNPTGADIVMLDISMPEMDGVEAAQKAIERYPDIRIITLSMYGEEDYYFKMVGLGVKGFLLKSSSINEVREAIDTVLTGGSYFSQEVLSNLIGSLRQSPKHIPLIQDDKALSEREMEILLEICSGLTNQEIAEKLFISKRTVDKHRANILEKTGCRNTANIVVYAIKNHMVEI